MQSHMQGIYQIQLCKWQTRDDSFLVSVIEDQHKMVVSSACQRNQHPWNTKCRKIYLCIIFKKRKTCCIICTSINFNSPLWSCKIFNTSFEYRVHTRTRKWMHVWKLTRIYPIWMRENHLLQENKKQIW
jgi:hypothetical protein